jgi:hypothetical protein
VPTFVISPWTLGKGVCSDQYDHTSIIQFLESVTGVPCPNLTNWRRNTFKSLGTITDFTASPPADSVSTSPDFPIRNRPDVETTLATGNMATFQSAFIVTVDGFEPLELTTPYALASPATASTPSSSCVTRIPTITITDANGNQAPNVTSSVVPQIDLDPNSPANQTQSGVPQRFTFTYSLTFQNINDQINGPFAFGANAVKTLTVNASFQSDVKVTSSAELELVTAQDPQFYHDFYNDTSWLSGELRVFSIPAGGSLFGETLGDPSNPNAATGTDALNFITGVISALNDNQPPMNAPLPSTEFPEGSGQYVQYFDDLNQDEQTNPLALFQTPSGEVPIFNFALARVHIRAKHRLTTCDCSSEAFGCLLPTVFTIRGQI